MGGGDRPGPHEEAGMSAQRAFGSRDDTATRIDRIFRIPAVGGPAHPVHPVECRSVGAGVTLPVWIAVAAFVGIVLLAKGAESEEAPDDFAAQLDELVEMDEEDDVWGADAGDEADVPDDEPGDAAEPTLAQEAERTAEAIREAVAAGVAEGRHETIYIAFAGGSKRGKVTGVSDSGIQVSLTGVTVPVAWAKINPKRLYFLGRKYLPVKEDARVRLTLARYCIANELPDEAQDELTKVLRADPKMRDDELLIATEILLNGERAVSRPRPTRTSIFSTPEPELVTCHKCSGTGYMHWMSCIQCRKSNKPGYLNMGDRYLLCNRCGGKGTLPGIRCDECGGKGKINPDKPIKRKERRVPKGYTLCVTCSGTGVSDWLECIQCRRSDYPGYTYFGEYYTRCNRCKGKGKLPGIRCAQCKGRGVVKEDW